MEQIKFSAAEKRLLRHLREGEYDRAALLDVSDEALGVAAESLKANGLIRACVNYGELIDAMVKPAGIAYLEEYPELNDPISIDIEELTKQNLMLQNNQLEYKEKIRKQERVIRYWQVASAILGFASLILFVLSFIEM